MSAPAPILLLLDRASEQNPLFCLTPARRSRPAPGVRPLAGGPPKPGEQYRFHFDMTKCIGCHCCEVACNEQNGNPADISWRRVGEIEGGSYPFTRRLHLSMSCNHCLEPACLTGCPVDAYTKDALTGLVLHNAEACIGCQYCTWNCPYGAPQFNPERGVVGKCDMCHGRLAEGREPACAQACPEEAIQIEIVDTDAWRRDYEAFANAPGLPPASQTISTTRLTLPETFPQDTGKADVHRVRPEQPHTPLILMTVFTQLSVGALAAIWLLGIFGAASPSGMVASLGALFTGLLALGASTLHLGRPIYAYRALRMWRRSWLSREVLLFSMFSAAAMANASMLWFGVPGVRGVGALAASVGFAAVFASANIYMTPARPAWDCVYTIVDFLCTGLLLGPLFVAAMGTGEPWLLPLAVAAGAAQLLNQGLKFLYLIRSDRFELRMSARMLSTELQTLLLARWALGVAGGIALPLLNHAVEALLVALAAELLSRYLFFVSVVPTNMASTFLGARRTA